MVTKLFMAFCQAAVILGVCWVAVVVVSDISYLIELKIKYHNSDLKKIHKNDKIIVCKLINRIGR